MCLFSQCGGSGQWDSRARKHCINPAFVSQQLKFNAIGHIPSQSLKSSEDVAAEFGTTFFFNAQKPVADMICFGLDWSYVDLSYAAFNLHYNMREHDHDH